MIKKHRTITIPDGVIKISESIKMENYKTNTPSAFQKHYDLRSFDEVAEQIADIAGVSSEKIDWVFFSASQGAEPHIDDLPEGKFTDTTFVVPIILPTGESVITSEDDYAVVELNRVYEFDHTKVHSMTLEDTESGCVVIMAAIKNK